MSADTWYMISLAGYFAALIGLVVTVVLYFRLDILDVIGDLTGRTVAKEIKSMRENRNGPPERPGKASPDGKDRQNRPENPGAQAGRLHRRTRQTDRQGPSGHRGTGSHRRNPAGQAGAPQPDGPAPPGGGGAVRQL